MDWWEIISMLLKGAELFQNIAYLVIGLVLGFCGTFVLELLKRQQDKREQKENAKKLLQVLSKEIDNGIVRCKWFIELVDKQQISFSRIYTKAWESASSVIAKDIGDVDTLILLYAIYYHFDLINFNMNQQRFGSGASYAQQYITDIEKNHDSLNRKIQLL